MGKGDLAVFHNGLLFLDQTDIIWRFCLAFFISNTTMLTITTLWFLLSTIFNNSVTPIILTISII